MNIIFIVSDTFRQDHLGCYGNADIRTPHLDRFARESMVFENCYHSSFPTMPLRADLFTGKYTFPWLGWAPLPPGEAVLADLLQKGGYTTLAAVDTPFFVRRGYGYDRGFKDFVWITGQGDNRERKRLDGERRYEEDYIAPRTIAAAEKLLEFYRKEKFFLYIDMWDPHEPWDPPEWYVEPYCPGWDGRIVEPCYWDYRERGLTDEDVRIAHACYCGEVTMVDRWVGRLLDTIKALGLWEDTAVIFTSDHGYYFGEHGFFGKGRGDGANWVQSPLYREITRVPLLARVPGMNAGRIPGLVSSTDLMPTVLSLAGIDPPEAVQGKPLQPLMEDGTGRLHEYVVSSFPLYNPGEPSRIVDDWLRTVEEPHFSTVSTEEWSFLYSTQTYPAQLYDTEADPGESRNVAPEHPEVVRDLHGRYAAFLEEIGTEEKYMKLRRKLFEG